MMQTKQAAPRAGFATVAEVAEFLKLSQSMVRGMVQTGQESVREEAGVEFRWHDLRHSFCTKLAEQGVPESTMLALLGHMSRAMLERYSHIRMTAKRDAVESLTVGMKPESPNEVNTNSTTQTKRATLQ